MSENKQLNNKQLENVNGGVIVYKVSQVTFKNILHTTVEFHIGGSVYNATVEACGYNRFKFCGQDAYRDVYQLKFNTDASMHQYYGGWYVNGEAQQYFRPEDKIDNDEVFGAFN